MVNLKDSLIVELSTMQKASGVEADFGEVGLLRRRFQ